MPACDRCRAQGIDCAYRPGKRVNGPSGRGNAYRTQSPRSHEGGDDEHRRHKDHKNTTDHDKAIDNDTPPTDPANTPGRFNHDGTGTDSFLDAVIGRTFDQFFRHVHHIPMYSFLHRASLMEQHNAGKVDKALLLALIGITSCLTDMGQGVREYGDRCIDQAESLIFSDYSRPSTFKVQALVLMIKHRILSNKYPSAFMLLSMASRFAAALRLNHNSPKLCFLAQESRRRLMWSLYCIDTNIAAGYRDFALWRAERIFVSLPCNERNFEFDLPQPAEMLNPDRNGSDVPLSEDVGSLALHIRILHLRQKIIEFTKDVLGSQAISDTSSLQEPVLALHKQLDDFASRLPASFQFSESSLRLRAYSPRICVFVMIHIWWHQCHCDLYRMTMAGFREALPEATLLCLDQGFLAHCQRQCVDHSLAMANIFAAMQKLGAKPVADLDLALCAYQCARMLKYALQGGGGKFGLTLESVTEKAKVCLQAIKECCMGPAAGAIRSDLERLISQGLGSGLSSSSSPHDDTSLDVNRSNHAADADVPSKHPVLGSIELTEDAAVISTLPSSTVRTATVTNTHPSEPSFLGPPITTHGMQTSLSAPQTTHAGETPGLWSTTGSQLSTLAPTLSLTDVESQAQQNPAGQVDMTNPSHNKPDMTTSHELNSAYEGALDGFDQDNGLAHAMGVELTPWNWSSDLQWPDFLNNSVGV
ncbi:hypothetical protein E4U43_001261 [Claviceps pusilla]|uniref:Xylanolytic transcriptional activator regulatory domain-containing protein n=1 Tax=Claviceps pusilla TaxID=123648 RepID=A0A9P7SZF5_9HYPO|nr:hypothetical protein E4U43_001261 [Claviceps pusilla]